MIICIGGVKGGSGKSTLAVNLAAIRASKGYDVLLVDTDTQATASDFTVLRESTLGNAGYTCIQLTGIAVRNDVKRLAPKYDDVIIDVAGRDTAGQRAALTVADQLVIPFVPRSFDVWTIAHVTNLLEEMQPANPELVAWTFLNKADVQGTDNQDTTAILVGAALRIVAERPDLQASLRAEPELIPDFLEEVLRTSGPISPASASHVIVSWRPWARR